MKYCLIAPTLVLTSALCGCTTLFGEAYLGSTAVKLQTALQRHPSPTFNTLFVAESNGVLQVRGFVNNLKQRNAVEEFVNHGAVIADLEFDGRIESKVVLYADYDCRASDECVINDDCLGDTQCYIEKGCYTRDECW